MFHNNNRAKNQAAELPRVHWTVMTSTDEKQDAREFNLYSIPSAWKGHEHFARWLVQQMRPHVIVELGCQFGFSAIAFAQPGLGTIYTIDRFLGPPERNTFERCRANIAASRVTNIELIRGDFRILAQSWSKPIDLLHIDGNHTYDDVRLDFTQWSPHVRGGGVILMHDTRSFPLDVGRFFNEITWPKFEFEHANGLGVTLKPLD
jgi:predicted O-methyltransferase YrrM